MSRQTVTYCPVCDDGWGNEDFLIGICCGMPLEQRPETDDEFCERVAAENRIRNRARSLDW